MASKGENSSAQAAWHPGLSQTYSERLQRLKQMSGSRKPTSVLGVSTRHNTTPAAQMVDKAPIQKLEAQTVGPKLAPRPAPSMQSTHESTGGTTLDSMAEQLAAELHLCDISLNELQSSLLRCTPSTGPPPVSEQSSWLARAPETSPNATTLSHQENVVAEDPDHTSVVKKLICATGQGCQSVLAPSLLRQPIPGVYWTTRTTKGAAPESSCTLLLRHAATTDLIVRLTVAEGSSVPKRVVVSTARKSTAPFEVLGEVQLAPGSHRHVRHVFRLAPGTIAGRCLRLDLVGRQVEGRAGGSAGTLAHRVANLLITGRKVALTASEAAGASESAAPRSAGASEATRPGNDAGASFFTCAADGALSGSGDAGLRRSTAATSGGRDGSAQIDSSSSATRSRPLVYLSARDLPLAAADSVLTGSPTLLEPGAGAPPLDQLSEVHAREEGGGPSSEAQRVHASQEASFPTPASRPDTASDESPPSAEATPAPGPEPSSLVLLGETWARYEDTASETARQASALARASRCLLACDPVLRALRCAHERAGFLFSGEPDPEGVLARLGSSLRAIRSARAGCGSLLDACALEAEREAGARAERGEARYPTLFIELEACEDGAAADCASMCANVSALQDLLDTEVGPRASDRADASQADWAAFGADAGAAQLDLESSVVQALDEYREACASVLGPGRLYGAQVNSMAAAARLAPALPSPGVFFPALVALAGDLDAALAARANAGPASPSPASAASVSAGAAAPGARTAPRTLSSATTPGSASRKRTASRDIRSLQASVMAGCGAELQQGGAACISPRVAALLAESERLIQQGRMDLGGQASRARGGSETSEAQGWASESGTRNPQEDGRRASSRRGPRPARSSAARPAAAPQRSTFSPFAAAEQQRGDEWAQSASRAGAPVAVQAPIASATPAASAPIARPAGARGVDLVRAAHLLRAARELARRRELEGLAAGQAASRGPPSEWSGPAGALGAEASTLSLPQVEAPHNRGIPACSSSTLVAAREGGAAAESASEAAAAAPVSVALSAASGLELALERAARLRQSLSVARREREARRLDQGASGEATVVSAAEAGQVQAQLQDEPSPARLAEVWRSLSGLGPLDPGSDLGMAAALASAGNSPSGPLVRGLREGARAFQALPSGLAPPPPAVGAPGAGDSHSQATTLRLLEPLMPAPLGLALRTSQVLGKADKVD